MAEQLSCDQRIQKHLDSRLEDLRILWDAYCKGEEDVEDLGNIYDYGLSIDYVPHDEEYNMEAGYLRYQLSWGGPSDEFRFYIDADLDCYKIEYAFLDWFDGATRRLYNENMNFMLEIYEWFREMGTVKSEIDKAKQ